MENKENWHLLDDDVLKEFIQYMVKKYSISPEDVKTLIELIFLSKFEDNYYWEE